MLNLLREIETKNFVVRDTLDEHRIAIGNLKEYGEGMYIEEKQIDALIHILEDFKRLNKKTIFC